MRVGTEWNKVYFIPETDDESYYLGNLYDQIKDQVHCEFDDIRKFSQLIIFIYH